MPVHLSVFRTASATSAACSTTRCASSRSRCFPADIPEHDRARRHRADHRPFAVRPRHHASRRPRSSTIPTPRSAPWWRRAPRRPRRWSEEAVAGRAGAHPEGEGRGGRRGSRRAKPSRRPEPCAPSWGWETPARSTTDTRHNAGFRLADRSGGPLAARRRSAVAIVPARPRAPGTATPVSVAQAADLHEPERGRCSRHSAPCRTSIPADDLLILVDDVALPIGPLPPARRGLAGGHNGLKSVEGVAPAPGLRPAPDRRRSAADRASMTSRTSCSTEFTTEERDDAAATLLDPMAEAVEMLARMRRNRKGAMTVASTARP